MSPICCKNYFAYRRALQESIRAHKGSDDEKAKQLSLNEKKKKTAVNRKTAVKNKT